MKVFIGILAFLALVYVTVEQGYLSSNRLKNLAGNKKLDLKSSTAKKNIEKLNVVKGKINKDLNIHEKLKDELKALAKELRSDKKLSIEEVEELRKRIVTLKKRLGFNVDLEDTMKASEIAYSDFKGLNLEFLYNLTDDEKDELFDPIGGRVWLNKYYLNTILRGEHTAEATQAEIKLNIQRRKLLSLRKKIKRSKSVIENRLDNLKSKSSKDVDLNNINVNEQNTLDSEERDFDE